MSVLEASWDFSAELQTVRDARRFLVRTLASWDCDTYDFAAPIVLSELATNAALHAKTPYTVGLRLEATHLIVTVVDANPRLPQTRRYGLDATTGRGMNLVASLSSRWGAAPTGGGKSVWAYVLPDDSVVFGPTLTADEDTDEQTGFTAGLASHPEPETNPGRPEPALAA